MGAEGLTGARTTAALVAACRAAVAGAAEVVLDAGRIAGLAPRLIVARAPDWSGIRLDADDAPDAVVRDILLFAGQSGGFWTVDAAGHPAKWARDGSGTGVLLGWLRGLAARGCLSGSGAGIALADVPADAPFRTERATALRECLDADRRREAARLFAAGERGSVAYDLVLADRLAALCPRSFGGDPFRKKALLALFAAKALVRRGRATAVDLPVAADYRLPQALARHGVIRLGAAAAARLDGAGLLDPLDPLVVTLRAATVVAGDALVDACRRSADAVDAALLAAVPPGASPAPLLRSATFWF